MRTFECAFDPCDACDAGDDDDDEKSLSFELTKVISSRATTTTTSIVLIWPKQLQLQLQLVFFVFVCDGQQINSSWGLKKIDALQLICSSSSSKGRVVGSGKSRLKREFFLSLSLSLDLVLVWFMGKVAFFARSWCQWNDFYDLSEKRKQKSRESRTQLARDFKFARFQVEPTSKKEDKSQLLAAAVSRSHVCLQ